MKLALTGTAVTNGTPMDLVETLMMLGIMDAVLDAAGVAKTSYHRRSGDPRKAFRNAFMSYDESTRKWSPNRAKQPLLNDALRATAYLRRTKKQVLTDLPPLRRDVQELALNGALAEYRRAERDIAQYIVDKGGYEALARAERAFAIVAINNLRRLAGEAKTQAAIDWIADFRDSRPDAGLVVFANHVSVQKGILEALQAAGVKVAHIYTGKIGQKIADQLERGEIDVVVASLGAAREGINLQARADTVLMVEQGWTPMESDQAEARVHRIGQTKSTEAVYLLAADTYDVTLFNLIDNKRDIAKLALEGEISDDDDEDTTFTAMMKYLETR